MKCLYIVKIWIYFATELTTFLVMLVYIKDDLVLSVVLPVWCRYCMSLCVKHILTVGDISAVHLGLC